MEDLVKAVSEEVRALTLAITSTSAYRKTYRETLLAVCDKMTADEAIEFAVKAAQREHEETLKIVDESLERLMKVVSGIKKAHADLDSN